MGGFATLAWLAFGRDASRSSSEVPLRLYPV
jgi:hypothetical protein